MLELTWGGWIYVAVSISFLALAFWHLYMMAELISIMSDILEIMRKYSGY